MIDGRIWNAGLRVSKTCIHKHRHRVRRLQVLRMIISEISNINPLESLSTVRDEVFFSATFDLFSFCQKDMKECDPYSQRHVLLSRRQSTRVDCLAWDAAEVDSHCHSVDN